MGEIVQRTELTAQDMKDQIRRIQNVMKAVMKNEVHFGIVPGTKKPSLWKPGAEVLCATFRIAATYPHIDDLSDGDSIRYRVRCIGIHQSTQIVLGEGMGEASSNEEKYKWRAAKSQKEFDETAEDRRRIKYGSGQNGPYEINQVRTESADQANTILKMACKRAQVAMTLNVTAASDIFSQDLEDLDADELRRQQGGEGGNGGGNKKPATGQPQRTATSTGKATERQIKLLHAKLDDAKIEARLLCEHFAIASVPELPFDKVDEALSWIAKGGGAKADAGAAG